MRVLVACEESQVVRDAFARRGHDAYSCDVQPCGGNRPDKHIQCDVRKVLADNWDLIIGHPPCTYLSVSGARWLYHPDDKHLPTLERRPHPKFPHRRADSLRAAQFAKLIYFAPAKAVAVENPVSMLSTYFRPPDQYVHPYYFGDHASKKTGLWLRNLPKLKATSIVKPEYHIHKDGTRSAKWHFESLKLSKQERQKKRSRTWPGFAEAMAEQWGGLKL